MCVPNPENMQCCTSCESAYCWRIGLSNSAWQCGAAKLVERLATRDRPKCATREVLKCCHVASFSASLCFFDVFQSTAHRLLSIPQHPAHMRL